MPEIARKIIDDLKMDFNCQYDEDVNWATVKKRIEREVIPLL